MSVLIHVLKAYARPSFRNMYHFIAHEKEAGEDFYLQNRATLRAFKKKLQVFSIFIPAREEASMGSSAALCTSMKMAD